MRDAKVEYYETLAPENGYESYYLYEEQDYDIIDESVAKKSVFTNISFGSIPKEMKRGRVNVIDIFIQLNDDSAVDVIESHEHVYASYHWFNEDKTVYKWDYDREPIPCNQLVKRPYRVLMPIQMPEESGVYYVQLDIVEEGVRWFSECGLLVSELIEVIIK